MFQQLWNFILQRKIMEAKHLKNLKIMHETFFFATAQYVGSEFLITFSSQLFLLISLIDIPLSFVSFASFHDISE